MIRFLADENFNGKVLRGIWRAVPEADILRVQDIIPGARDERVLEFAARNERILLTHDAETMPGYVNDRLVIGLPMPGVIVARQELAVGIVITELLTILGASEAKDWENLVTYLPL